MQIDITIKYFADRLWIMAVASNPQKAVRDAVDEVTADAVSIGDHNPEDIEAFDRGKKEQKYYVDIHDLSTGKRGQVIVELTKRSQVWEGKVINKFKI